MGHLIGKAPPDRTTHPGELQDRRRRQLRRQGWDGDRAVEFIRRGTHEDSRGRKQFSPDLARKRGG